MRADLGNEEYIEQRVTADNICAEVQLDKLLLTVIGLKKRAITKNDWELYWISDGLEHDFKLLKDENNRFQR